MSETTKYQLCEIAEVQTGPFGSQLHMSDYVLTGTPIITVEHFGENKIIHENLPLVSAEDKKRLVKYTLREGDVVFSRVGSVDRRVYVTSNENGWMFSGRCLRVRPLLDKVNGKYLSYYFGQESFKEYIRMNAVGATMPSINTQILSKAEVIIHDLGEQESIAEVLSSLDDKIDLLHHQNKTLEELAETLFRQWFVEEADDSWREVTLENYIEIVSGYSYRSVDLNPSNTALVTLKNFERTGGFRIDGFKEYTGKYKKEQIVTTGDLIVAHTDITQEAEVLGNPALVIDNAKYHTLVISTDLAKVNPTSYLSKEFLYYLLRTDDFKHYCLGCSNGTTVLHLSKKALPNYTLKIPPVDKVKGFTNIAISILIKVQANHNQIISLEGMRDTLLPKLMSGAVRVTN